MRPPARQPAAKILGVILPRLIAHRAQAHEGVTVICKSTRLVAVFFSSKDRLSNHVELNAPEAVFQKFVGDENHIDRGALAHGQLPGAGDVVEQLAAGGDVGVGFCRAL